MPVQNMIFVPAGEGDQASVLGSVHINKAVPAQTDGAFTALEIVIPPNGGPPMHRHDNDAECFYVLEGEVTFESPDGAIVARPGDIAILPRGGAHAFRNDGEVPARAFVMITPGRDAHAFFHEASERLNGAVDPQVAAEIGARNGLHFIAPSAAA